MCKHIFNKIYVHKIFLLLKAELPNIGVSATTEEE